MARTELVAQNVTDSGLAAVYTAANVDGHWIEPGDIIHVVNGAGASINVTLVTGGTFRGKAVSDTVVAVVNGTSKFIRVNQADLYAQPSGADEGRVYVDFSSVTSITVACLRPA